jgi:hypothetical protein
MILFLSYVDYEIWRLGIIYFLEPRLVGYYYIFQKLHFLYKKTLSGIIVLATRAIWLSYLKVRLLKQFVQIQEEVHKRELSLVIQRAKRKKIMLILALGRQFHLIGPSRSHILWI